MKKHPTENKDYIRICHAGVTYQFPKKIAAKYRIKYPGQGVDPEEVFADLYEKYTKPGVLLQGLRLREQLTQVEMAKTLKVTQSNLSQMEKGMRPIGRTIAKRIEALYNVNYRLFLA